MLVKIGYFSSFLLLDTKFHRIYLRKLHIFVQIVYEQNLQAWIDHEFDMCALLMAVVTAWYMQKSSMHGRAQCSTMGPSLYEVAIAFIIIYFTRFSQMLNACSPSLKLWKFFTWNWGRGDFFTWLIYRYNNHSEYL